ncbi:NAD(P)H-dependent flavin oxidoreductase [uncultured Fusobacterium sp.]|jgi:NAD(P)H-dependent flavin oxidoreductase YrpB (nitropropane dioxygenase family)|uniref:NAD(P)H-dependent flavin oxidoreductase n=1 Tax=Fusobacterium TaxID=848 RepID=UPI00195DC934|nr:nitronate monooxygenase [uncultured Fusobacterium sp.]MBM6821465.1 nitronate monooxygenase [Fusobacterium mortiferum]
MVKIGDLEIKVPIIQGGMAIRVSMAKLAAAVANEGGLGVIAGTTLSTDELKAEIKKARDMITNQGGALGVNIMYAVSNFMDLVKASIEAGIDVIIFGAGFSRDIFEVVKGTGVKVIPIVSTLKLAKISQKLGADAIVVEGGNAGGHLGTDLDSWDIMEEITQNIDIPVFGAGGVITPEDAQRMLSLGVDGVQMGSRFVASEECEVDDFFKNMYVNAKEGDIVEMMSSAGLPANAIMSPFVQKILDDNPDRPTHCVKCLKKCTYKFCVNERLVRGHDGDYEGGIFFAGRDAWKINEILSVHEIFNRFKKVFKE